MGARVGVYGKNGYGGNNDGVDGDRGNGLQVGLGSGMQGWGPCMLIRRHVDFWRLGIVVDSGAG